MTRVRSILASALFTIVVPGSVAILLPWLFTRWRRGEDLPDAFGLQLTGGILIALGVPVLLYAIYKFATEGLGTPAPIAPTQHLVIGGPNRFVRNPMYLAVVSIIIGQALLLGDATLLWYGAAVAIGQALFVHFSEEPAPSRPIRCGVRRIQNGGAGLGPSADPLAPADRVDLPTSTLTGK